MIHGVDVEKKFLYRLNQELDARGLLDCLRHGIMDYGKNSRSLILSQSVN